MDLEFVNVKSILDNYGIEISTSGKNVTRGWIEINCPFCSDPSFHLGISSSNIFNCWRCGEKGNVVKLLKTLLEKPYNEVMPILEKYSFEEIPPFFLDKKTKKETDIELPRESKKQMPKEAERYLLKRNFNPRQLSAKYKLRFCENIGNYKFRIVVPIFKHGKLVSFIARDYSGRAKIPYLLDKDSMEDKRYLYNIDEVKNKAIVVEGVFDAWRFGSGAIATLGTRYTKSQVLEIARLGLEYVAIVFDPEPTAQKFAKQLAVDIKPYVEKVDVIEYEGNKDPADLFEGVEEAEEEKKKIFDQKFI